MGPNARAPQPLVPASWLVFVACGLSAVATARGCRDDSVCTSYDACSNRDLLFRTGHLCRSFPWYQGHEPLRNGLQWTIGRSLGGCSSGGNGTCSAWWESDSGATAGGISRCTCVEMGAHTCVSWTCVKTFLPDCPKGYEECGPKAEVRPGLNVSLSCCDPGCYGSGCVTNRTLSREDSTCSCPGYGNATLPGPAGNTLCPGYKCYSGSALVVQSSTTCLNVSRGFCYRWTAYKDAVEDAVSLYQCSCSSVGLNGNYCSSWSCDWKSFGYFDAALGWVGLALVGSLVAFPLSLVKGIRSCRGREFYFVRIMAVVADVGMQAASLWAGGFVPLFLAMLLHIILGGGIFLVWFARRGWSFHHTGAKKAEPKDVLNPIVKERRGSVVKKKGRRTTNMDDLFAPEPGVELTKKTVLASAPSRRGLVSPPPPPPPSDHKDVTVDVSPDGLEAKSKPPLTRGMSRTSRRGRVANLR